MAEMTLKMNAFESLTMEEMMAVDGGGVAYWAIVGSCTVVGAVVGTVVGAGICTAVGAKTGSAVGIAICASAGIACGAAATAVGNRIARG